MKRRSPNLTPDRVDVIVEQIRSWEGRLTWPALITSIATQFHARYTRQALFRHDRIRIAYEAHRNRQGKTERTNSRRPISATLNAALERIQRLEQENVELRKREELLFEQFHRWAYHASSRGLTRDFLDRPLPPVNRKGNPLSSRKIERTYT